MIILLKYIISTSDISSYIYTTSLSSPDPTSTSFTGTFTSKSQYAFNDDKIEFTQNSLVIYNVDNVYKVFSFHPSYPLSLAQTHFLMVSEYKFHLLY